MSPVGSAPTARSRATAPRRPTLRVERTLQRAGHRVLAGMDEVGRGALAGPVSVGVVLIDERCRSAPVGVADSKLLSPARREALVVPVRRWALAWGVGHAGPDEIDTVGIMGALRLAGRRALAAAEAAAGLDVDLVILDGSHDWLTDPLSQGLFGVLDEGPLEPAVPDDGRGVCEPRPAVLQPEHPTLTPVPPVQTMIKADRCCSSVAAASILAKVERDAMLVRLAEQYPAYRWELNKGYAAPEHLAALAAHGPCLHHRRSWRLPGCGLPVGDDGTDGALVEDGSEVTDGR